MVFQSCCWRFSLRTGCITIGVLGILINAILYSTINVPGIDWKFFVVDTISWGLLIAGAVMEKRFLLLPSIVINILNNIALWMFILLGVYVQLLICKLISSESGESDDIDGKWAWLLLALAMRLNSSEPNESNTIQRDVDEKLKYWLVALVFVPLLIAIIHMLLIKVIIDHFEELLIKTQRGESQYGVLPSFRSTNGRVLYQIFSTQHTTAYDSDLPRCE